jgi:hypothetical protein
LEFEIRAHDKIPAEALWTNDFACPIERFDAIDMGAGVMVNQTFAVDASRLARATGVAERRQRLATRTEQNAVQKARRQSARVNPIRDNRRRKRRAILHRLRIEGRGQQRPLEQTIGGTAESSADPFSQRRGRVSGACFDTAKNHLTGGRFDPQEERGRNRSGAEFQLDADPASTEVNGLTRRSPREVQREVGPDRNDDDRSGPAQSRRSATIIRQAGGPIA